MNLDYNLRGLFHLFFRQKVKFLITMLLILVPSILMVLRLEPYYEKTSSILLKFGQNARLEVNLQNNQRFRSTPQNERGEVLQSNVQILRSADLIKQALSDIQATDMYPELSLSDLNEDQKQQRAVELVQKNLTATAGVDNYLIKLDFRHNDPKIAVNVTSSIIEAFKKRYTEIYETPQTNFLEEQSQKAQQKLDKSREEFIEFKKQAGISEIDSEIEQLLRQKNDVNTLSYKSQTEAIAYESVIEAQEKVAELESEAAKLMLTYRLDSPVVQSMNERIALAKSELSKRKTGMSRIGNKLAGSVSQQNNEINQRIAWLEAQRGKFNELEQQVKLDEENIKYYRQRMEEARVNSMLNDQDITRISVIEEPQIPLKPSGPNKKLILIALIIFACGAAAIIAILYELLDDRFSFPNQIRTRFNLPVLATFSEAETK